MIQILVIVLYLVPGAVFAWNDGVHILICYIADLHHPFCQEKPPPQHLLELWNSLFGTFAAEYTGSFEEDEEIKKMVHEINEKFSFNVFSDERQRMFGDWADQSARLARMIESGPLTSEYTQRYKPIALRQIAIAGYHLADILNKIF